jgi:cardiolipin synthase
LLLRQLPNLLTALRMCAAPLTALFILSGQNAAALGAFAFAGLSDLLDGYLARRLQVASRFGVFLDPVADKLLMLASFVTLTLMGAVPLWLTVIVIARDIAIVGGIALDWLLAVPLHVEALTIGKISTVLQVAFIGLVLLLRTIGLDVPRVVFAAALATGAVTVASWLAYGQVGLRALFSPGRRTA